MAKIYSLPEGFNAPELDFSKIEKYKQDEKQMREDLKKWCKKRNPTQECVGETISFPVADSSAEYMVAAIAPVELIHLPFWDAWTSEYAHKMTKKQIIQKVNGIKLLEKIFPKRCG